MTALLQAFPLSKAMPHFLQQYAQCSVIDVVDGDEIQFSWVDALGERPVRIPRDRNGSPHFDDGRDTITIEKLAQSVSVAGVTGWNYKQLQSRLFIFDFDAEDHAAGHDDLSQVIEAAKRLGWVSIRRSKGGRGVHLVVILAEPMPAATGEAHQANAASILARMSTDAAFDFAKYMDCGGVVGYIYAAGELPTDAFAVLVQATERTPSIAALAHPSPEPTEHLEADWTPQHQDAVDKMRAAGFYVSVESGRLTTHSKAFELIGDPSYKTKSPGRNPSEPNCFAYPTADGFAATRFGVQPEAEAEGWHANAKGFATTRVCFPIDMSRTAFPETPLNLTDELRLARHFASRHQRLGLSTLVYYLGGWYKWDGFWQMLEQQQLTNELYRTCKSYIMAETAKRPPNKDGEQPAAPPFGKRALADVEMALRSLLTVTQIGWTDGRDGEWLAFRDSLLDLRAWLGGRVVCVDQTPEYFSPHALDYPLSETEDEPATLLAMLRQQFNEDEIAAIQEFFGYAMTTDTRLQRILIMIGPPRSGKGTVERTGRSTIGDRNVASKNLESFLSPHALEDLPEKTLLAISDSRPDPRLGKRAVERLLGISGGDPQNINPKGRTHYSVTLPCKIMLASNIIPAFDDPTGALLSRFLFVQTKQSFAGKEDPDLLSKILAERNEVTWWFLRGLQRLLRNGRYTEPENDLKRRFKYQNSPVSSFVAECCTLDRDAHTAKEAIWGAFEDWCESHNVIESDPNRFFRQLYDEFSDVKARRINEEGRTGRVHVVAGLKLGKVVR